MTEHNETKATLRRAAAELANEIEGVCDKDIIFVVKKYAYYSAVASCGSSWISVIGPAVSLAGATGFVTGMIRRINKITGIELSKDEIKKISGDIVDKVLPGALAALAATTGISLFDLGTFINFVAMPSVCYHLALSAGVTYIRKAREIYAEGKDNGECDVVTPLYDFTLRRNFDRLFRMPE